VDDDRDDDRPFFDEDSGAYKLWLRATVDLNTKEGRAEASGILEEAVKAYRRAKRSQETRSKIFVTIVGVVVGASVTAALSYAAGAVKWLTAHISGHP
jgi:hypothetical protein